MREQTVVSARCELGDLRFGYLSFYHRAASRTSRAALIVYLTSKIHEETGIAGR